MRVRTNGVELEVEITGKGEPLLLVMGLGAQLIHWPDELVGHLVERGFQVIRFDNRDVGLSSKHDGRVEDLRLLIGQRMLGREVAAPYTLVDMADDAAGVLDVLGIPSAHVAGVSMGGMIAQTLALAHPHRVRSLTSIMSSTGARRHLFAKPRAAAMLLRPAPRTRDEAVEGQLAFFRAVSGTVHRADEARVRDVAARAYDRCFYPAGFVRQLAAILASGDRGPALRFVRAKTTVLHGGDDPLILPAAGRATAAAIPGARLRIIEGMGHDLPRSTWSLLGDEIVEVARRSGARP